MTTTPTNVVELPTPSYTATGIGYGITLSLMLRDAVSRRQANGSRQAA